MAILIQMIDSVTVKFSFAPPKKEIRKLLRGLQCCRRTYHPPHLHLRRIRRCRHRCRHPQSTLHQGALPKCQSG